MSKQERWESIVVLLAIISLWPILHWHNQARPIPQQYWFVLLIIAVVLGVIMARRIRRLRDAMRAARRR